MMTGGLLDLIHLIWFKPSNKNHDSNQ